jgi:predicted nucleic acid-binding protein
LRNDPVECGATYPNKETGGAQADMLIPATAWTHNLILATRNTKDFEGTAIPTFNTFDGR